MSRSPFQRVISELRRRHVPQTAAVYLAAAWAAIEFADAVVPNLNGPQWVVTAVIVAALVRTADGRKIRRAYRIVQLPGGTP